MKLAIQITFFSILLIKKEEIKLGEFKIIKKFFPDRLGNPTASKNNCNSSKTCQVMLP